MRQLRHNVPRDKRTSLTLPVPMLRQVKTDHLPASTTGDRSQKLRFLLVSALPVNANVYFVGTASPKDRRDAINFIRAFFYGHFKVLHDAN